ncbi:hypothetical protein Lgra_2674 [Legionella gratiana]|uniref:Uncharacterized protein n=1 Tax=Legionella gratiana TaxID=45066 RepID=A0A378J610_9GAMM|nr:hypothetical protein [Legionella gratiana]KTD05897.1 hypothetical protein Lgra_2674 [Legionella gratiana]STX42357.1 Uncharacterised protein [Legionella gratiana]
MKSREFKNNFFNTAIKNLSNSGVEKKIQSINEAISRAQHEVSTIEDKIAKSEIGLKLLKLFDQIQDDKQSLKLATEENKEGLQALAQTLLDIHEKEYKIIEEQCDKLNKQLSESKELLNELNEQLKEVLQSSMNIKPL